MSTPSTLITSTQQAPAHYNPANVYDSDSSDSDSSSDEESVVDNEEAVEKDEEAFGDDAEEEFVEGNDDDDAESPSSTEYSRYQVDDDHYELAPTEDLEEDSLALTEEGLDTEDTGDTVEDQEDEMEDFLLMALEEGSTNECPLEERDLEATLQSKVELNDTCVQDQVDTIQPSLPAPDLLPVPKPTKRSRSRKSKGKNKLEDSEKPPVNKVQSDEEALRQWKHTRLCAKAYSMPFTIAKPSLFTPGEPISNPQKRARALSQNNQYQPSDDDTSRTPKRARLDQDSKASTSAAHSSNSQSLVGGLALARPSFRLLWDEVAKSDDYQPVAVPTTGKAEYHARLLSKYPHLQGETFFAKEQHLDDGTVIECPVTGCGASLTVGKLGEHVQCHKNGEGKFTCSTKSHKIPKPFAKEKAMVNHVIKEHLNHYHCPHCDIEMRPEMNKYVKHLLVCTML